MGCAPGTQGEAHGQLSCGSHACTCRPANLRATSCLLACTVVPVFIFDPRYFGTTEFGSPKTGRFRARFLRESVADLRQRLRALGSDLLVGIGRAEELLPLCVAATGPTTVLWQVQLTSEELAIDRAVRAALPKSASCRQLWSGTLYSIDDLPYEDKKFFSDMGHGSRGFMRDMERHMSWQAAAQRLLPTPREGTLPLPSRGMPTLGTNGTTGDPDLNATLGLSTLPSAFELGISPAELNASVDSRAVLAFVGGEGAAKRRLKYFLWVADCLGSYFETRNGMLGSDYSSKFSPWLAHGCLSARYVAAECVRYEAKRKKNKSTYWMIWELAVRDHTRFKCLKLGDRIFTGKSSWDRWVVPEGWRKQRGPEQGALPFMEQFKQESAEEQLQRWKEGRTGIPLVDANMRELAATGFMSNRGRMNVASFLIKYLALDWRLGADHFETLLLDYDICINWGNWMGMGTAGRRTFNMIKQANEFDPRGDYVRHWLPELALVPAPQVHEPWKLTPSELTRYRLRLGRWDDPEVDYPLPPKLEYGSPTERSKRGPTAAPTPELPFGDFGYGEEDPEVHRQEELHFGVYEGGFEGLEEEQQLPQSEGALRGGERPHGEGLPQGGRSLRVRARGESFPKESSPSQGVVVEALPWEGMAESVSQMPFGVAETPLSTSREASSRANLPYSAEAPSFAVIEASCSASARRLPAEMVDWRESWSDALEGWWLALPLRLQLDSCLGALALHLGARFEMALRNWGGRGKQPRTGTLSSQQGASRSELRAECEWVRLETEQLTLPQLPQLPPADFKFQGVDMLFPLPRWLDQPWVLPPLARIGVLDVTATPGSGKANQHTTFVLVSSSAAVGCLSFGLAATMLSLVRHYWHCSWRCFRRTHSTTSSTFLRHRPALNNAGQCS